MIMRYLWGLGVGHTYTHRKTKAPAGDDGIDHDDAGEDDQWLGIQNEDSCDSDDFDDDESARESDVDSEILEVYGWLM
jgi:hypothetical protein